MSLGSSAMCGIHGKVRDGRNRVEALGGWEREIKNIAK